MDNMPFPLFCALEIFDTYLEPQSPPFQDLQQARLLYYLHATSYHASKKSLGKLSAVNFLTRNPDEKVFKTEEDLAKIARQKEEERKAAMMSMFDPAKLEELRAIME
ncbi:hypothetical protein [Salmonella enterica]|uniref:hypothetical protein n=1 Tax=Salmonella enterica TaxID=28901 RepID=UPI00215A844C|nr:hypothetical protein [Salmonella enterica]